jgi:two-component system, NtrC family, nitrogen regulation sensor histidine kinase NtrY
VVDMSRNRCMIVTMTNDAVSRPTRRQRKLAVWLRRKRHFVPAVEVALIGAAIIIASLTYISLSAADSERQLLAAPAAALLLLLNLAPAIALLVLVGRRVAKKRAAQSQIGGNGLLHVRLVATFSLVATVPMVLMVMIASLLFQYGVDTWYSKRARQMFENTTTLAQSLYAEKQKRVTDHNVAMAGDLRQILAKGPIDSPSFANDFVYQVYQRELSEGAVLAITPRNGVQSLAIVNPYERPTGNWVPPEIAKKLMSERTTVFRDTGSRMEAVTPIPGSSDLYLYVSVVTQPETLAQAKRAALVLKDYNTLSDRSRKLQLQLNVVLYLISLIIIGGAVWIALGVADRLVRPVNELVSAARKVAGGDLAVKVSETRSRDEVGVLSRAFNRMTERLNEQNIALVATNDLLDRRRALTEAVLSGVTAGVIAVGADADVRLLNSSACTMLKIEPATAVGKPLSDVAPELAAMLGNAETQAIVQVAAGSESRTLAVKIVADEVGHVLTFDDITQQLLDQRRAAWSDVARRVAHEIKNPLTPIQLAAERLKRRFTKEIVTDAPAFERLTDTIIRQVGDLRRMVDEFSSFARMPKPVFGLESVIDVAREAMFLHEVANPGIKFKIDGPTPSPQIVCDRRQLGQALSNIVKNGVEAITQDSGKADISGTIQLDINSNETGLIAISVADSGIGLPIERDRIIEPYMTTRAGGTGLGLAIVKKIVEEHLGSITFADRVGGGTVVTITLDPVVLSALDARHAQSPRDDNDRLPAELTRMRNS